MTVPKDTVDELTLFQEAMADVQVHAEDRAEPYRKQHRPKPLAHTKEEEQGDDLADLSVDVPEFLEFRRPGIQHRVFHDLQRGYISPEDSLDLHGMRVTEARPAFARFLANNLRRGVRCVRIIHGKGRGSAGRQPVLKQKTYHWLLQKKEVLAFATAPRWDGGTGAVYVLLSRKKCV